MKSKFQIFSLLASVALLFQSCFPEIRLYDYSSEAELTYLSKTTKTYFKLMKDDKLPNTLKFGVVAAKDNETLSYILLAPPLSTGSLNSNPSLADVSISNSVTLTINDAKKLIEILNSSIQVWKVKPSNKEGVFYEFNVLNDKEIIIRFTFQNSQDGSFADIIFLKYPPFGYGQSFTDIENLKELKNLLTLAINK